MKMQTVLGSSRGCGVEWGIGLFLWALLSGFQNVGLGAAGFRMHKVGEAQEQVQRPWKKGRGPGTELPPRLGSLSVKEGPKHGRYCSCRSVLNTSLCSTAVPCGNLGAL